MYLFSLMLLCTSDMSHVIRKPAFCIYAKTGRRSAAWSQDIYYDYHYTIHIQASLYMSLVVRKLSSVGFVFDLVGNPEVQFSHNEAHLLFQYGKDRFSHYVAQLYNFFLFYQIGCHVIWLNCIFF